MGRVGYRGRFRLGRPNQRNGAARSRQDIIGLCFPIFILFCVSLIDPSTFSALLICYLHTRRYKPGRRSRRQNTPTLHTHFSGLSAPPYDGRCIAEPVPPPGLHLRGSNRRSRSIFPLLLRLLIPIVGPRHQVDRLAVGLFDRKWRSRSHSSHRL